MPFRSKFLLPYPLSLLQEGLTSEFLGLIKVGVFVGIILLNVVLIPFNLRYFWRFLIQSNCFRDLMGGGGIWICLEFFRWSLLIVTLMIFAFRQVVWSLNGISIFLSRLMFLFSRLYLTVFLQCVIYTKEALNLIWSYARFMGLIGNFPFVF